MSRRCRWRFLGFNPFLFASNAHKVASISFEELTVFSLLNSLHSVLNGNSDSGIPHKSPIYIPIYKLQRDEEGFKDSISIDDKSSNDD